MAPRLFQWLPSFHSFVVAPASFPLLLHRIDRAMQVASCFVHLAYNSSPTDTHSLLICCLLSQYPLESRDTPSRFRAMFPGVSQLPYYRTITYYSSILSPGCAPPTGGQPNLYYSCTRGIEESKSYC
ncbi:hypothetical protein OH76DRAFT_85903 [Lentinus brumalis]|uniref:Uncharacterized protein n=1 Tax=Lentinus brumalis TaxID=2498619 RepID=A0A371CR29_9APHY|nr:hypothetical protein OH76DRAFT_85903 [Polyporus brumalis]